MVDGYVRIRTGERKPVAAKPVALSGELVINPAVAPVCTLYDFRGNEVPGMGEMLASGYETASLPAPKVWFNFDTLSPIELSPGYYTLVFRISAIGSDGLERVFRPAVIVHVEGGCA
jgi:hypothetical protein